jgi:hypothetical protein
MRRSLRCASQRVSDAVINWGQHKAHAGGALENWGEKRLLRPIKSAARRSGGDLGGERAAGGLETLPCLGRASRKWAGAGYANEGARMGDANHSLDQAQTELDEATKSSWRGRACAAL